MPSSIRTRRAAVGNVYKADRDLQQELGREARISEIAERLELSPDKVREIIQSAQQPVSLETPLGGEDSSGTLGDLIADAADRGPHQQAVLCRHMDDAMQVLTPCERQVLRLRYGLSEDGREHTLVELGEMLGVSPERVRQVESAALHKLRKPAMRRRLRDYLDEYIAP